MTWGRKLATHKKLSWRVCFLLETTKADTERKLSQGYTFLIYLYRLILIYGLIFAGDITKVKSRARIRIIIDVGGVVCSCSRFLDGLHELTGVDGTIDRDISRHYVKEGEDTLSMKRDKDGQCQKLL